VNEDVSKGVRAAIAAYVLWGFLTIYWKQLADFDPFELIGWRVLCATVVLAAIITTRHRWPVLLAAMRNRRTVTRLAIAAVLLTANWTAYVWAVTNDRIIETALGYFMAPLGTMILGVTVLHEHASRLQKLAIGLAALAVVVLTVSYGRPPLVALILAATWSTYGLLKRQVPLSPIESLAGETFLLTIPAAVLVLAMAGASDSIPSTATGGDWVLVLLTGVVTAVPLLLFAVAARRVPFTLLGALQYLVPTINFLLGWLVYDEPLPLDRLVGFALVWAALVAVAVDQMSTAPRRVDEHRLSPTAGS
jgi:chloramphenicol-sensitive protein RarD